MCSFLAIGGLSLSCMNRSRWFVMLTSPPESPYKVRGDHNLYVRFYLINIERKIQFDVRGRKIEFHACPPCCSVHCLSDLRVMLRGILCVWLRDRVHIEDITDVSTIAVLPVIACYFYCSRVAYDYNFPYSWLVSYRFLSYCTYFGINYVSIFLKY